MGRRLTLVRPPRGQSRADVVALIQRHAEQAVDWLMVLCEAYADPTATDAELARFRDTAIGELEARIATLRADLRGGDR